MGATADVVLIIRCPTVVGRATAETGPTAGYEVIATARKPEELEDIGIATGGRSLTLAPS
jgi:NADP-dependent 3-hydroxy acid dehydrogenase YdfG